MKNLCNRLFPASEIKSEGPEKEDPDSVSEPVPSASGSAATDSQCEPNEKKREPELSYAAKLSKQFKADLQKLVFRRKKLVILLLKLAWPPKQET